jgi:hypothetical protein
VEVQLHAVGDLGTRWRWSASRSGRFTPSERALGTHWIGGWVGFRAGLDAESKRKIPNPRRDSNPDHPIVQPVVSRYTDWAIPALIISIHRMNFWCYVASVRECRIIMSDVSRWIRKEAVVVHSKLFTHLRGCIQKFPDWVDKEIYAYNNKHSLRSNTSG